MQDNTSQPIRRELTIHWNYKMQTTQNNHSDYDGTITETILETLIKISHACRDIYMNITQALVTVDF